MFKCRLPKFYGPYLDMKIFKYLNQFEGLFRTLRKLKKKFNIFFYKTESLKTIRTIIKLSKKHLKKSGSLSKSKYFLRKHKTYIKAMFAEATLVLASFLLFVIIA